MRKGALNLDIYLTMMMAMLMMMGWKWIEFDVIWKSNTRENVFKKLFSQLFIPVGYLWSNFALNWCLFSQIQPYMHVYNPPLTLHVNEFCYDLCKFFFVLLNMALGRKRKLLLLISLLYFCKYCMNTLFRFLRGDGRAGEDGMNFKGRI